MNYVVLKYEPCDLRTIMLLRITAMSRGEIVLLEGGQMYFTFPLTYLFSHPFIHVQGAILD